MQNYQGKTLDLNKSIIGKVTRKQQPLLSRHKYILISNNINHLKSWGYSGFLTAELFKGIKLKKTCLLSKKDLDALEEGDILLIEPNEFINVLWRTNSIDNIIIATERCNCNCVMCPQPPKFDQPDREEINLKIIKNLTLDNTKSICITGGEPTLLGERFIKLIKEIYYRLPNVPLFVLSNGKNFHDFEFTKRIASIGHKNLIFCIALYSDNDTDHDKIVGTPGSFYKTIKGITNLALFSQKIEIRNVITALNYERLPQYSEFIYKNFPFIVHIALMAAEMTGNAAVNSKHLWIDPVDYMPQLEYAVKFLWRRQMNVSLYNLQFCILPRTLWPFNRNSIADWKKIYYEICFECDLKSKCGGMFSTSGKFQSKSIHAIKNEII